MARVALVLCAALALLASCSAENSIEGRLLSGVAEAPLGVGSPTISPGPGEVAELLAFLDGNGFTNFSSNIQNFDLVTTLSNAIGEGKKFTILAPGDYAYVSRDIAYPNFCKDGDNYDVDVETGLSTHGLLILPGYLDKATIKSLPSDVKLVRTLTPVPLTLLPSAANFRLGVVDGFGRIKYSAFTEADVFKTDSIVVHGVTDIIDYPQLA